MLSVTEQCRGLGSSETGDPGAQRVGGNSDRVQSPEDQERCGGSDKLCPSGKAEEQRADLKVGRQEKLGLTPPSVLGRLCQAQKGAST